LLPPTRLLTLGFDPARFQTEPPACYRASWQLPGWDSHPQATTSLCWITIYTSTSNPGHTAEIEQAADPPLARKEGWRSCRSLRGGVDGPKMRTFGEERVSARFHPEPRVERQAGPVPLCPASRFCRGAGRVLSTRRPRCHFERQADLVVTGPALSSGGKAGVAGYRARSKKDCATLRRASLAGDLARGR